MENEKVVSLEEKKEEIKQEEKEEGMSELKRQFVEHLQRSRSQGVSIGSKTIAFAIMSMTSRIKDGDNIEELRKAIDDISALCERTTKLSVEEFLEYNALIEEIMNVAPAEVDFEEEAAEEQEEEVEEKEEEEREEETSDE